MNSTDDPRVGLWTLAKGLPGAQQIALVTILATAFGCGSAVAYFFVNSQVHAAKAEVAKIDVEKARLQSEIERLKNQLATGESPPLDSKSEFRSFLDAAIALPQTGWNQHEKTRLFEGAIQALSEIPNPTHGDFYEMAEILFQFGDLVPADKYIQQALGLIDTNQSTEEWRIAKRLHMQIRYGLYDLAGARKLAQELFESHPPAYQRANSDYFLVAEAECSAHQFEQTRALLNKLPPNPTNIHNYEQRRNDMEQIFDNAKRAGQLSN